MHSAEELDLNSMKLMNLIYKMRYFIAASMNHFDLFHEWLNLSSTITHRERIEKFHTEFSLIFRAKGLEKKHTKPHIKNTPEDIETQEKELFIKALFGEEVYYDTFYSGLLQNNAMGLYNFLRDVNNALIKKHLLDNIIILEEAFSSWQKYHDDINSGIKLWLKQSKIEIDKKATRKNVDALMKYNLRTKKQPDIITPELNTDNQLAPQSTTPKNPPPDLTLNTKRLRCDSPMPESKKKIDRTIEESDKIKQKKATPRTKIPLENPDDFPSTHKLLHILERSDAKQFAFYITSALNLYQSFKQLSTTHHFKELLELDNHILKALMHSHEHYLKRYCNLVKNSVPAGYIVGKGWLTSVYSSHDKIAIEKYWSAYIDLLKSHLKTHDKKPLHTLMIELIGDIKLDEDQITECSQTPPASQEKEDKTNTEIPNRLSRWNTFYSDGPSQYLQRLNIHSANKPILKRCFSVPSTIDFQSAPITDCNESPPLKISKT